MGKKTHLSFMNMPDETISATSNGTRTAIVILTDLKAIEKKNPEIKQRSDWHTHFSHNRSDSIKIF